MNLAFAYAVGAVFLYVLCVLRQIILQHIRGWKIMLRPVPYGLFRCIECGCCAYVCPGRVPIVGLVRRAKEALSAGVGEEQEEGH